MTDWQITKKCLTERCDYLFESGQWHDCEFVVGMESNQQVFQAHRLILATASPVFEAMLFGGMAEKAPIKVLDVSPEAFRSLMMYIYSDKISLQSFDQACDTCYAAKKYMLPHLVEHCTKYLWKDVKPHNVCRAYEFARLFEEPILMEKCMKIIAHQTDKVFGSPAIEEVEHATLMDILSQKYLNVCSELEVFRVLLRWSKKECQRRNIEVTGANQRMVLGPALFQVRFFSMDASTFASSAALSGVLTQEENLAVLMNILTPGRWKLPDQITLASHTRKLTPSSVSGGGDGRTQVCVRPMLGEPHALVRCQQEASLTLAVNQPIRLLGVIVPSQVTDIPTEWLPSVSRCATPAANLNYGQNGYSELLYAYVTNRVGSRLTYTHFTSFVNYNDMVEIMFNRPTTLLPGELYRIGLVLNKNGWYPMGVSTTQVQVDSVVFSFGQGEPTDTVRDGLIRKIVYSVDASPSVGLPVVSS